MISMNVFIIKLSLRFSKARTGASVRFVMVVSCILFLLFYSRISFICVVHSLPQKHSVVTS